MSWRFRKETPFNLRRLLYKGGASIPVDRADEAINRGLLGNVRPDRAELVRLIHEYISGVLAGGARPETARRLITNMTPFFGWADSAGAVLNITMHGRDKLEGFLEQVASCLLKQPNAALTDMRPVLNAATEFVPNLKKHLRLPYLALHALFNLYVSERYSATTPAAIETLIQQELDEPSPEALIAYALFSQTAPWSLDVHQSTLQTCFRRRSAASGLRFPRLFEAAVALELAERLRKAGDMEGCRDVVALAVENHPGNPELMELETNLQPTVPIIWRDVMLPSAEK